MIYTKQNIIFLNFNYNNKYLIIGLVDGYEIYKLEPFEIKIKKKLKGAISIIDMLENTNILVFSGTNENNGYCDNNTLILYDDNENKELGKINCDSQIFNIKITTKYILIVLVNKVLIYNLKLEIINYIETGVNIHGIISIYYNNDLLKYSLMGKETGNIIVGTDKLFSKKNIKAHDHSINLMNYNKTGLLLATTSNKGTIIRLFNAENDYQLFKELRRGSTLTRILNMNFNDISNYFICSTINGKIHIFNTGINNELNHIENKKIKYLNKIKKYIPINNLYNYIDSEWSFTNYHNENIRFVLISIVDKYIYGIGSNGKFYKLLLNKKGEIEIVNIIFFTEKYISPFNIN